MKHQITTLQNGLRVVTASIPGSYSATISITAGVGSRYENFAKNGGVSHFLEHLLFKGTKKRPSAKIISEQIDAVGGWNNAYTSNELTNYYVKVPHQHINLGLDILADMVKNSLLDEDEINRERDVILEEMNVYQDDPASYVHRLTPELLWPNHPLAHEIIGSPEVIKSVSRQEIVDYLETYYQPSNLVVTASGKIDHAAVVAEVGRLMGDLTDKPVPEAAKLSRELSDALTNSIKKDTAQAHILISTVAYPYRHANDPAARVLTTILGRGMSSRLFLNVRESKGLAYSISASLDNYVDSGQFDVYAGVNIDKTQDAITAIIEELKIIATQPVGTEELEKAKNQIKGGLQMAMENNTAVTDRLATQLTLLGEVRTIDQTLAEIDAVTVQDVQRVGSEMLELGRLRFGIISPEPDAAVEHFKKLVQ